MKNKAFVISVLCNLILATLLITAFVYQFRKEKDPIAKIRPFDVQKLSGKRIERILEQSPPVVSIVMLGNSITEFGENWNTRLQREDVLNSGQGGYTTGQLLWLIDPCVLKPKPRYCFTLAGINDISLGIPVEKIMENYRLILDTLLAAGIQPVVQSTLYQRNNPAGNNKVTYLNYLLKDYCFMKNIPYINLNRFMSDEYGLIADYTTDGTHLTEKGYAVWTDELKKVISELD